MRVIFGANARGGPDTRAAAKGLGVSQRTVQRWLHGQDRWRAKIPDSRLREILWLIRPDEQVLRAERYAADYARDAVKCIRGRRGILPAWRKQHWLDPHLVVVLRLHNLGLHQVVVSRGSSRAMQELRRRGVVVDETTVDSRFHGTALAHELLQAVDPWRAVSSPALVKQGHTQTWMPDAPVPDLEQLAVTTGLWAAPSPGGKPARKKR